MAIRQRERGAPMPPLHWLRGWGKKLESWLGDEHWTAGLNDWMVTKPDAFAADAMMEFSIDYPAVIQELRRLQTVMEEAWTAALDDLTDSKLEAYAESQDVLSRRIRKACDLIETRTRPAASIEHVAAMPADKRPGAVLRLLTKANEVGGMLQRRDQQDDVGLRREAFNKLAEIGPSIRDLANTASAEAPHLAAECQSLADELLAGWLKHSEQSDIPTAYSKLRAASFATPKTDVSSIPIEHRSACMTKAAGVKYHNGGSHSNPSKYLRVHPEIRFEGSGKKYYFDVRDFPKSVREKMKG